MNFINYNVIEKLTRDRLVHLLFLVVMRLPSIVLILWPGLWPGSPWWSFVNSFFCVSSNYTLFTHRNILSIQIKSYLLFSKVNFVFQFEQKRLDVIVFLFGYNNFSNLEHLTCNSCNCCNVITSHFCIFPINKSFD